jgi:hypothetical protein
MKLGWAACLTLIAISCNEGVPIIIESSHRLSPDSKWEFTLEHADNGMGFGMGAIYDEVHIHKPGKYAFKHGDKDISAIFYIESTYQEGDRPIVRWVDPHHLIIQYPSLNHPGRAITQFKDVSIEYQPFVLQSSNPTKAQSSP